MPDTLCRLAVQVADAHRSAQVDLVIPSGRPIGELIPPIVEAIWGDAGEPQHWHLSQVAGDPLDPSLSLYDNAVRDGDVVVLATVRVPPPRLAPNDACAAVARTASVGPPGLTHAAMTCAAVAAVALSAVTLVLSGFSGSAAHLWTAAGLSAVGAVGATLVDGARYRVGAVLRTAAIVFAVSTGILAAPGTPWQAVSLLAASSALTMSVLVMRTSGEDAMLTASAAAAAAVTVAAAVCLAAAARPAAAGAMVTAVSLAALATAPRLALLVARLGPATPEPDDQRATTAHRVLTGLVAGWSASAALGAVVATAAAAFGAGDPVGNDAGPALALAVDVGLLLILRARSHADPARQTWLRATGVIALCAALLGAAGASPAHAFGLCAAAVVAASAAVHAVDVCREPGPTIRHSVQVLEYVTLAAVVPLAGWVAGLYGLVRDASLG